MAGAAAMVLAVVVMSGASAFAADRVAAVARTGKGFGRIVLTFPSPPKYTVKVTNGVVIVTLDRKIETDIRQIPIRLPDFVVVSRLDPDGKGLRFALAQPAKVNTMEAGEKLFIDLLPKAWVGLPPALPAEVVADLAKRAERVEKEAKRKARMKALERSEYKVNVRLAEYPSFTRIQFDWNKRVKSGLSRSGDIVTVRFDQLAKPDIARMKAISPRFIKKIDAANTNDGLKLTLTIEPGSDVRGFKEGQSYVVDISGPPGSAAAGDLARKLTGRNARKSKDKSELITTKGNRSDRSRGTKPAEKPTPAREPDRSESGPPKSTTAKHAKPPARSAKPVSITGKKRLDRNGLTGAANGHDAGPRAGLTTPAITAQVNAAISADRKKGLVTADKKAQPVRAKAPKTRKPAPTKNLAHVVVRPVRVGSAIRLTFPFQRPVSAAVFTRSKYLKVVVDTRRPINLSKLKAMKTGHFSRISQNRFTSHTVLRFKLSQPYLTTASGNGNSWILTIGDLIVEPVAPVSLARGLRSDGRSKVTVDYKNAGQVHWITDGEIGDKIAVVTAYAPTRGMLKAQNFVDFTGLATSHGLAIKPHRDDLEVKLSKNSVTVTRQDGLSLSSAGVHRYKVGRMVSDQTRPGFIDYKGWAIGDRKKLDARVSQLEHLFAMLPAKQTLAPRFELARIYLARRYNAEAIGVMKRIVEIDPQIKNDPVFNAMRGVANLMMHRNKTARADLTVHGLKEDPDAALWRGLLNARDRRWREAQLDFLKGDTAISSYPKNIKTMFRLAAVRAALGTNDLGSARFFLDAVAKQKLTVALQGQIHLLRGRFQQALGKHDKALAAYQRAIETEDRRAESEARFHRTLLALRLGKIDPKQAINALHSLSLSWRGDTLEAKVLRKLAELQRVRGDFRASLQTMKTAVRAYPDDQQTALIQDDMARLFEALFLHGKADKLPPVKALGLYYDFSELTPVGRLGDEMIRRLADRLISVDLLEQASEILAHQVDKRLIGAARSQVAAKLAMVHLLNLKPAKALRVLRKSRVAVLPKQLLRERLLLEARALSELGRTQSAIELLANETGMDVKRLRAEALWRGKKWRMAGEAIEKLLGESWKGTKPFNSDQRLDVLRAAIAYSFAKDTIGLSRFRTKYGPKMLKSKDRKSFDVVTRAIEKQGIQFRHLAKEIAAIDTLEGFLAEFRKRLQRTPLPGARSAG